MKNSKINSPFVLEFVLSFLKFPQQLASFRLVNKYWNTAVLRAINYQLRQWETELQIQEEQKKNQKEKKFLQGFSEITTLVRKSDQKGHFFVKVRQIGNMPRPHQTYFHFSQLLSVFLERPKLEKWEDACKIFKDPYFFKKMQQVHLQRKFSLKKIDKFRSIVQTYPSKLNYAFL